MEKENNRSVARRRMRERERKPSLAVVSYTPKLHRFFIEFSACRQVCRTLGLVNDFGHPEIETLYEFSGDEYSYPLLSQSI